MSHVLWLLLPAASIVISHLLPLAAPSSAADSMVAPPPWPDCPRKCGEVDIPYPFGIGKDCSWRGMFSLTCNDTFSPPRPYDGNIEVLDISLEAGEIRLLTPVSYQCPSTKASTTLRFRRQLLISTARNEFTAIGCNTLAFLNSSRYYTGCITSCVSQEEAAQDGDKCSGLGCCQMPIAGNLSVIRVLWGAQRTSSRAWSPCSYAFVAEKNWYKFQREDLVRNNSFLKKTGNRDVTEIPLVLDWAINGSCPPRTENDALLGLEEPTATACVSANSHCVNASQGTGYLCNCTKGYSGNPYVNGGCTNPAHCTSLHHLLGLWRRLPSSAGRMGVEVEVEPQQHCSSSSRRDG